MTSSRIPVYPGGNLRPFPCSTYCPEFRAEHPGFTTSDVAKEVGEMEKHTAVEDKQPDEKKLRRRGKTRKGYSYTVNQSKTRCSQERSCQVWKEQEKEERG